MSCSPTSMEMHISFKFNNMKKENSNGALKKIFSQLILGYFRNRCTAFHEFLIHGQNALFPFLHVWFYFYSGVSGPITRKLFWYIIQLKIGILIYMEFYWDNISNSVMIYGTPVTYRHCTWQWWYKVELGVASTLK